MRERGPQISSYAGAGSGWGTTGPGTVVDDAGTWIRRGVEEARILGDAVSKVAASGRGGTWRCTLHLDQIPETACIACTSLLYSVLYPVFNVRYRPVAGNVPYALTLGRTVEMRCCSQWRCRKRDTLNFQCCLVDQQPLVNAINWRAHVHLWRGLFSENWDQRQGAIW